MVSKSLSSAAQVRGVCLCYISNNIVNLPEKAKSLENSMLSGTVTSRSLSISSPWRSISPHMSIDSPSYTLALISVSLSVFVSDLGTASSLKILTSRAETASYSSEIA